MTPRKRPKLMHVTIVRHGKARPESPTGLDCDRELKPRGERQAVFLGDALADLESPPEIIVSSPILRARRTAELIAEQSAIPMTVEKRLSTDFGPSDMLAVIEKQSEQSVCIVGHNPTCAMVVAAMTLGPTARVEHHRTGEAVVIKTTLDGLVAGGELLERIRLEE